MLTRQDLTSYDAKLSLTKNLVSDQTYTNLSGVIGTSSIAFDVTSGLGVSTATSTAVLVNMGGFNDQRVTATMRYIAPTTAGSEHIGVLARCQTLSGGGSDSTYYLARVQAGVARLTRVNGGVFTNLSSSAFALAQGINVTIILTCAGSAISARFTAAGGTPTTVNLSGTDSSIASGGLMGFRTTTCTGYCSTITVEEL